jgi:hypothetical protein
MGVATASEHARPSSAALIARLQGSARVLGLAPIKTSYGLRSTVLDQPSSSTMPESLNSDLLLILFDFLVDDRDKVALACTNRGILAEQRRLRPLTRQRMHVSLGLLVGARRAGWRVAHCHVDKRSGTWVTSGQEDDVLADLEVLSIVGRPDCALLVLSPFTDLTTLVRLQTFELDSCAIGNAGVGVLSAALRNGAMPALTVLDLRRNQIGDGGALALAAAISHGAVAASPPPASSSGTSLSTGRPTHTVASPILNRLTTLGLDQNPIGEIGLNVLAAALRVGSLPALRYLFVDCPSYEHLAAACEQRQVEATSW